MRYSLFRGIGMVMDWCFRFRFGIRCSLMVGMVIVGVLVPVSLCGFRCGIHPLASCGFGYGLLLGIPLVIVREGC